MRDGGFYDRVDAFIEQDQIDWTGDGVAGQLVSVSISDEDGWLEPAVCCLSPAQARELAFGLLCLAEQAQRMTRDREREQ
jgi:hypothetical protein